MEFHRRQTSGEGKIYATFQREDISCYVLINANYLRLINVVSWISSQSSNDKKFPILNFFRMAVLGNSCGGKSLHYDWKVIQD